MKTFKVHQGIASLHYLALDPSRHHNYCSFKISFLLRDFKLLFYLTADHPDSIHNHRQPLDTYWKDLIHKSRLVIVHYGLRMDCCIDSIYCIGYDSVFGHS